MAQYNLLNVKLFKSQLNKLKSGIKNGIEVTLSLSLNVVDISNDESNISQKLLLINTKVSSKPFANGSSANIKFLKNQLSEMIQLGGFGPLSIKGTLFNPFRMILKVREKFRVSGIVLTNNEIKYIIKVIRSLENRGDSLKRTTRKVTNQEEGFLNFLRSLMATALSLMKTVFTPLAKNILVPLGLTATASTTDAGIQNISFGSGTTALEIWNEEMDDIIKIVKSAEESSLLIKAVSETVKYEAKEQKGRFLSMSVGTFGASLF